MNENRRLSAEVLARRVIQAAFDVPMAPRRAAAYRPDDEDAPGEALGRAVGLALLVGAKAEGFNPHSVLTGIGQALGEYLGGAGEQPNWLRTPALEVMVENVERGAAAGLGIDFDERPSCGKCRARRG